MASATGCDGGSIMRINITLAAILSGAAVGLAADAQAQRCTRIDSHELAVSDGRGGIDFGRAMAISGQTAVIGSFGAGYVYRFDGSRWAEQAKLHASDGASGNGFGWSVAIDDGTILVGVPWDDDNGEDSGSAIVFRFDGTRWAESAKLLPADGMSGDRFGFAVAVSGDTIVIGAQHDRDNGPDFGSAYVFTSDGTVWTQQAKLLPDNGDDNAGFGSVVSVVDGTVLIGAPYDDDFGQASGAVCVYQLEGTTWTRQAKLHSNNADRFMIFGQAIAQTDNLVMIGAEQRNPNGPGVGLVKVFSRQAGEWTQRTTLRASDAIDDARFGSAIALHGNIAVIGAQYDSRNGTLVGAAYVFRMEGSRWIERMRLLASDWQWGDQLGSTVAHAGGTVLVAARGHDEYGTDSGGVFAYELVCVPYSAADISGSNDPSDPNYGRADGVLDATDWFYFLELYDQRHPRADMSGSCSRSSSWYGVRDYIIDYRDVCYYLDVFALGLKVDR